jgi:imidazolonepropionase-like amidohydrolase
MTELGALRGVRVYRNGAFGDPEDIVIDGAVIGTESASAPGIETGGFLIPGLIDSHVHIETLETLETFARNGVTTVLDMANPMSKLDALRGTRGVADFRAAGIASTSPTSAHARMMRAGPIALVASPADAEPWVAARVAEGADYIKVVIDLPGFDLETVSALVTAAHAHGRKVVAHAARWDAVAMAQGAGVDILTHAPIDRAVDETQAAAMTAAGTVIVPTLIMMEGMVGGLTRAGVPGLTYEPAPESVARLHAAGMPILAGTDANAAPGPLASPAFGESLHRELELLVAAGLSPVEALEAATTLPARYFELDDRGRILPGLRADLVLLDENPLETISATRSIRGVWVAGQRV